MMIRRLFMALAAATLIAGAAVPAIGFAAQSAQAKATVDAGKAAGRVGEQGDGFLGVVSGSDAALKAAIDEINAGRTRVYADTAAKSGVTPQAAGEATARQLIDRLAPGQYYKPLGGAWTRK